MTHIRQIQNIQHIRQLCPHLAAAALWATKRTRHRRNQAPRVYYARAIGPAGDDFVAL